MLATVMEGALAQYQRFTPGVRLSTRPMECYVFAQRGEWAKFTKDRTGADAAVYLQINRGGYTVRDWYVAYFIGDMGTYSVAAHEGWHQFIARHFKSRPPPFLEEGLACMFEEVRWDHQQGVGRLPRWDLVNNASRRVALKVPLATLPLPVPPPATLRPALCRLKVAVTDRAASRATTHSPVPLQSPSQPAKAEPDAGVALRVTPAPPGYSAAQVPVAVPAAMVQAMPSGLAATAPAPSPAPATVSVIRSRDRLSHSSSGR